MLEYSVHTHLHLLGAGFVCDVADLAPPKPSGEARLLGLDDDVIRGTQWEKEPLWEWAV